ncbi:MAG: kelch repeat-containing protein [Caldilineaceae bacterium]
MRYDLAETAWEVIGDLPVPLAGASLVSTPDALYLLGGWDGESMHAEVWQIALPIRETVTVADWQVIDQMKTAHAFGGAVLRGNEIYVAGGYDGRRELDTAQRYNIDTGRWESLPSMATARGHSTTRRRIGDFRRGRLA